MVLAVARQRFRLTVAGPLKPLITIFRPTDEVQIRSSVNGPVQALIRLSLADALWTLLGYANEEG